MDAISKVYSLLWKPIIRPPRDEYTAAELGPKRFRLNSNPEVVYERIDLQLDNERGQKLECSYFRPVQTEEAGKGSNSNGLFNWIHSTATTFRKKEGRAIAKTGCVIFLHGNSSSRLEAIEVLPLLLRRNMTVFCMDLSGSGMSDGDYISLGFNEQRDLKTAIEYLRNSGFVNAIGLWGRSMGAATSVLRAAEDADIAACVLDSPFSSLPMVAEELVNSGSVPVPSFVLSVALEITRSEVQARAKFDIYDLLPIKSAPLAVSPALFATAEDDTFVLPHHTKDLHDVWGGDEKIFVTFDGGHNGKRPDWFLETAAGFLEKQLAEFANGVRQRRRMEVPLRIPGFSHSEPDLEESVDTRTSLISGPSGQRLSEMGFSKDTVAEALQRHSTVENAVAWMLKHSAEAEAHIASITHTLPSTNRDLGMFATGIEDTAAGLNGVAAASTSKHVRLVEDLLGLGFSPRRASEAARRCSSIEAAVEWLTVNCSEQKS